MFTATLLFPQPQKIARVIDHRPQSRSVVRPPHLRRIGIDTLRHG